ncbi:MAG: tetratricopeptide repeat protein [Polyangiaceae bacterium]|nr:tetratricopeptide repeat protein [Polyangiaceae bacterium]
MMVERVRLSLIAAAALSAASLAGCGGGEPQVEDPTSAERNFSDEEPTPPPPGNTGQTAQKSPSSADLQRGKAHLEEGKFAEAKDLLEKARAGDPKNVEAAFYLALAKEKLGDKAGAEQAYMDALKLDPKLAEAAANLTALYLEEPARPDEAIKILKDMLAKVPKDTALMTNLAYAYTLKKDVANASKQYEAILAGGGGGVDVRLAYGQLLLDAGQKEKAAEQLKKGLEAAQKDAPILITLGLLLGQAGAFGDCVKAFDKAIAVKSDHPEPYVRRGICRHELNDEAGARSDYEAAIKIKPDFAAAHYYLGVSWMVDKKYPNAKAELTKASTLAGDSELGKRARQKLSELPKK